MSIGLCPRRWDNLRATRFSPNHGCLGLRAWTVKVTPIDRRIGDNPRCNHRATRSQAPSRASTAQALAVLRRHACLGNAATRLLLVRHRLRQQLRHSKRSDSGERGGVAELGSTVWHRAGCAQPVDRREGSKLATLPTVVSLPPPTASAIAATAVAPANVAGVTDAGLALAWPCGIISLLIRV